MDDGISSQFIRGSKEHEKASSIEIGCAGRSARCNNAADWMW
jgi:hypothetical protein